ncbi:MAG: RNA polymerase sigma factor [Bacteroidota bacterium]
MKLQQGYPEIHKDLIEAGKNGSSSAQYKLYKLYSKAMFSICCRMLNCKEEAEDMLQESFSEAFLNLGSFRYESSFGAWLKRIIVNHCINEIKRKKTALVLAEDMEKYDKIDDNEPVDDSKIKYEVQKVMKAVEMLPDGYRVIFSLYMLEGYDHTEISEILNISESTSKSQYLRAKNKIKEILKTQLS